MLTKTAERSLCSIRTAMVAPDLILKGRTSPQLRFLQNNSTSEGGQGDGAVALT